MQLEIDDPLQPLETIHSSGCGSMFDAFYTTKPQGLGIGLAISRSIIEADEGRFRAKTNPTRGALFQFTLPIRPSVAR